jgi:hypothetical protein
VAQAARADGSLPRPPWRAIFSSGPVWGIIIAHTSSNFSFYMLLTCLPSYFSNVLNFKIAASGMSERMIGCCCFVPRGGGGGDGGGCSGVIVQPASDCP